MIDLGRLAAPTAANAPRRDVPVLARAFLMGAESAAPVGLESPNVARVYDFFLGGAHNFPADREAAAKVEQTWPQIRDTARVNRLFLGEAVRYLAGGVGGLK
jgi:hypothetical protein